MYETEPKQSIYVFLKLPQWKNPINTVSHSNKVECICCLQQGTYSLWYQSASLQSVLITQFQHLLKYQ